MGASLHLVIQVSYFLSSCNPLLTSQVYLHLPNGTIHMHSKEKEANFTDYKQLNCYKYNEDNTGIEKTFYESNELKLSKYFTRK